MPAGNSSSETFRYFESLKSGCITVTPMLPSNRLYELHPGIQLDQINDADAIAGVLRPLLEESERHESLQAQGALDLGDPILSTSRRDHGLGHGRWQSQGELIAPPATVLVFCR